MPASDADDMPLGHTAPYGELVDAGRGVADSFASSPFSAPTVSRAGTLSQAAWGLDEERRDPTSDSYLQTRTVIMVLLSLGLGCVYAMRMNLSEAMLPMAAQYGWDEQTQGYVLSSFFWGYILGQIPGGILAHRFGGKVVFGVSIFSTSVFTMLVPVVSSNLTCLYAVRALTGLGESVCFPAVNMMYSRWAPAAERSRFVAASNAGTYVGTALAFPISGWIIGLGAPPHKAALPAAGNATGNVTGSSTTTAGAFNGPDSSTSWPWVFYSFGIAGFAWCVAWARFAASSPAEHSRISAKERAFIEATVTVDADRTVARVTVHKSPRPPWLGFLTCPAAFVLYFNHFVYNWGAYTLMTLLPQYLSNMQNISMKSSGVLAALPYIVMFLVSIAAGRVADRLVRIMSLRATRTLMQVFAFFFAGLFLVLSGLMPAGRVTAAVALVTLSIGASAVSCAGYNCSYLDLSPHYAGLFYSVGNTISNTSGIVAPIFAGWLLEQSDKTREGDERAWQLVFYTAALLYAISIAVWVPCMPGKPLQSLN